jgi:cytochrome c-type biogenesis protein CcmH
VSLVRAAAALMLVMLATLPGIVHADALDDGVRRVGLELQCPVCEGESIADSPSGLANDMRGVIRTKLAAGESDQQILDEFVASYGDSILTEPPKHGVSLGVWLGPAIGVTLGALALALIMRTWRRAPAKGAGTSSIGEPDPDVAAELHRFREEFGR